jgi:hypothetical protein
MIGLEVVAGYLAAYAIPSCSKTKAASMRLKQSTRKSSPSVTVC